MEEGGEQRKGREEAEEFTWTLGRWRRGKE
jgi:hypothetical protein